MALIKFHDHYLHQTTLDIAAHFQIEPTEENLRWLDEQLSEFRHRGVEANLSHLRQSLLDNGEPVTW
jgi:hypothetical protein